MQRASYLAIIVGSSLAAACSVTLPGTKADFEYYKAPLAKTAAFDLGCAADKLSFTPVGSENDGYDKVGVMGCSKKATYTQVSGAGWIKTSETDSTN